jgi:hypothetical protein
MIRRTLSIAALATLAAVASASSASAGSPCCCVDSCVVVPMRPVKVYVPYEMPRIYIVDQGPVYSGPGIYTNPTLVLPHRLPRYPYVGRDYPTLPPYREPLRSRAQY